MVDILGRIERLEAVEAIRGLASRYCVAIDDRDLRTVFTLFTEDARVFSRDGVMDARGSDAIMKLYEQRYAALGPTLHITHDHLIDVTGPNDATGLVTAHAEVWRNGKAQIAALRYHDRYRREDGQWCFSAREMLFFYYLEPRDYADALGRIDRVLTYDKPAPADFPERGVCWQDYR